MTILAIDPGPTHSALVVWDGAKIHQAVKVANGAALSAIDVAISKLATTKLSERHTLISPHVTHIACERVESFGMAVGREVFETCFWSGRFWQKVEDVAVRSFHLIPRREVKLHLCGQARAKDSNIRQALIDRFGGKGTVKNKGVTFGLSGDTWAAFALAVTCFDRPELLK